MGLFTFLFGKRKNIELVGLTGAGKSTILKTLKIARDLTDKEYSSEHSQGRVVYKLKYKTKDGNTIYIRSVDGRGYSSYYNSKEYEHDLKKSDYIVYLINVNLYLRLINGMELDEEDKKKFKKQESIRKAKEQTESWLFGSHEHIQRNPKKKMIILATHSDEYLKAINVTDNAKGRERICYELRCNEAMAEYCNYEICAIDSRKYNEIQNAFDYLFH